MVVGVFPRDIPTRDRDTFENRIRGLVVGEVEPAVWFDLISLAVDHAQLRISTLRSDGDRLAEIVDVSIPRSGEGSVGQFDHVVAGRSERQLAAEALDRTAQWLERCAKRHSALASESSHWQTLWPILQGATFDDLRRRAVKQVLSLGEWSGVAVGGLAVGEPRESMLAVLDGLSEALPSGIPRYLMGVGFPSDLLEAISRAVSASPSSSIATTRTRYPSNPSESFSMSAIRLTPPTTV